MACRQFLVDGSLCNIQASDRSGFVQSGSDWLVAQAAHDDRYCDGRFDDGLVPPSTGYRHDASFGPRQPIRQPWLSGQAEGIWHDVLDESQGELLGHAPTESWFNSFKNERYHGLRYATHAEMKAASFEYIEVFYNRIRQHSPLGYRSPMQ
jgi:hypothetical protein